jgi:hypothetical protein
MGTNSQLSTNNNNKIFMGNCFWNLVKLLEKLCKMISEARGTKEEMIIKRMWSNIWQKHSL